MRTYSGFLLLEDMLDFLPGSNSTILTFATDVTNPQVTMVSQDCLTTVGTLITINYEIEGRVELATGLTIDKNRIDTLLGSGIYSVAVRDLYSCVAPGGICRSCYAGSFIDQVAPSVGKSLRITSEYNFQNDVFLGNSLGTVFTLTQASSTYTKVLVVIAGVIQTTGFTIAGTTLTMTTPPASGTHVVVKYYKITAQPYIGYLSETYSGSLLGMKPLPTQLLKVRPSLIKANISNEKLSLVKNEIIKQYKAITSNYLDYIDSIKDRLEKALYLIMLYGIYANVSI